MRKFIPALLSFLFVGSAFGQTFESNIVRSNNNFVVLGGNTFQFLEFGKNIYRKQLSDGVPVSNYGVTAVFHNNPVPSLELSANNYVQRVEGAGCCVSQGFLPQTPVDEFVAFFRYDFLITAPTTYVASDGFVPVDVSGVFKNTRTGPRAAAYASVSVTDDYSNRFVFGTQYKQPSANSEITEGSFAGTINVGINPDTLTGRATVYMSAYIGLTTGVSASSFIDPYLQINEVWAEEHPGFSLATVGGVGNTSPLAVPEPTSAALMLSGLILFAKIRRRKSA